MQSYRTCRSGFKYFTGILVFVLLSINVFAQPVKVEATIDTNNILIGDQIHFNLDVLQEKNGKFILPGMGESLSSKVELLETYDPDTNYVSGDQLKVRHQFLITSFDSGRVEIPPIPLYFQSEKTIDTLTTQPLAFHVRTVRVDSTKTIFDIKGPAEAPVSFMEILPYLGGLVGLAALVLLIIYIIKRYRRRKEGYVPEKPKEPAHVIAFRELGKLKEERLWQKDQVKLYYTQLADILRTYLWHRYNIKTLERTTDEILGSLRNRGFEHEELFEKLQQILKTADLVKFAKLHPAPEENDRYLEEAYEFVEQTKMRQETQQEDNKQDNNNNLTEKASKE